MNMCKQGSALLVILIILSLLMLLMVSSYTGALFFQDYARQVIKTEQKEGLTRSLLACGIDLIGRDFDKLAALDEISPLLLELEDLQGQLQFSLNEGQIMLSATLLKDQNIVCEQSCKLSKRTDGKVIVWGFQRGSLAL